MIDYLGDFRRSARLGQPVYRITGGPGYIWAASFGSDGRGTLRLTAADLSGLGSVTPPSDALTTKVGAPAAIVRPVPSAVTAVGDAATDTAFASEGTRRPLQSSERLDLVPAPASGASIVAGATAVAPLIQTVVAQGMGTDVESATKNAAENALTQVVGSFIDTEKMLEKRSQIVDGIRSETRSLRSNVREYSQGSIKALEVVDTTTEGGLVRIQARVTVRVEDFKAYIKKVAVGETAMGAGLFAQIATAHSQQQSLEGLLKDKIVGPIAAGEVVRISVGSPVPLANSDLVQQQDHGGPAAREISQMNRVLSVVFPVEVSLDESFGQNLVRTLESTATDKLRQQESLPLGHMCQIMKARDGNGRPGVREGNAVSQSDTGVKLLASTDLMTGRGGRENTITETYKLSDVRLPRKDWIPPKLNFQILSRDGTILWERFFSQGNQIGSKVAIVPHADYSSLFLPWTLVREDRGCVFIARRSKFSIVAEMNPETLKAADRATVKFTQ
ncbi:hypothetical protein [Methylobacterium sp. WL19]|uniref:hypothetical protein n=1 Tax=Methylobacterium sp. WL19 TaxID=2603896 RepID=UPI0011C6ECFA|nr:hypothetical protein [Methylobacterium sp. WL19]TXN29128.1 hypothetical protein FV220_07590 [Methylobacterium sp. WL19]